MTGPKSLPSFSRNWVGGDIWGLDALDARCERVASVIADADRALSRQVASVVGAGSWQGKAADAFTAAWDRDSAAGAQLADAWRKIGAIAGNLAGELATLENALEEAAYQLEKQGIPVDQATGTPMPDTTAGGNACVSPSAAVARGKLADDYAAYRAEILDQATTARARAARDLDAVTQSLLPPGTDWGQLANDLDALRSLWAIPTERRKFLQEKMPGLTDKVTKTQRAAWEELLAARKRDGNAARLQRATKENAGKALKERTKMQSKIDSAPENASTKLADGDAEGLGFTGVIGDAVRAVPYIGAAAGVGLTIAQDREDHESWRHAVVDGVVSNGAGLGGGAAGMTGGIVVAGFFGAAPVVAVTAGTLTSVGAAVGVGDFVHNVIQENWGQDWHQHGVLDGTAHGIADSFDKTRHDMAHYLDDLNPF